MVIPVTDRWTNVMIVKADGAVRLPIGPGRDTFWSAFQAELDHSAEQLLLTLVCRFRGLGHRIEVRAMTITARNGRAIAPRDLSSVELARAVYLVAEAGVDPGDGAHIDRRPGRRPTPEELKLVADVYSWTYAAWGAPTRAVMEVWDIPRSTANRWLRSAKKLFPTMPGEGGEDDGQHQEAP